GRRATRCSALGRARIVPAHPFSLSLSLCRDRYAVPSSVLDQLALGFAGAIEEGTAAGPTSDHHDLEALGIFHHRQQRFRTVPEPGQRWVALLEGFGLLLQHQLLER